MEGHVMMFLCVYVPDAHDGCSASARVHVYACACVCMCTRMCPWACVWSPVDPFAGSEPVGSGGVGFSLPAWRAERLPDQVELTGADLYSPPSLSQEDENVSGTF